MVKREIYWNEKLNDYTLEEKIGGVKSIKKIPIRFKIDDKTAKYRQDILEKEIEDLK